MPKYSSIEIDKNNICYANEVLKISNISRTWIFKLQNKEKKAYEQAKIDYRIHKRDYELRKKYEKNEQAKKYTIAGVIIAFFSIEFLQTNDFAFWGLVISILCGLIALKKFTKKINYDEAPPVKREFPNRFGLGIQMNSGYLTVFTAEGSEGIRALQKLQEDIKEADIRSEKTIFNMNEYNVKVDGDIDGIVNFGDDNININKEKELENV